MMRKLWYVLRNFRRSSPSDLPLRRGGWNAIWVESVRSVQWTDEAEEKWRRANPTLPHLLAWTSQSRIPKRTLEEDSSKPPQSTSSTLTITLDAPRRSAVGPTRARGDSSSERRPCLPAATDLGGKRKDDSAFRCGDRCTFDHDWKTIKPRVLARYFSETALPGDRQVFCTGRNVRAPTHHTGIRAGLLSS
jgi:hypothetical protein